MQPCGTGAFLEAHCALRHKVARVIICRYLASRTLPYCMQDTAKVHGPSCPVGSNGRGLYVNDPSQNRQIREALRTEPDIVARR